MEEATPIESEHLMPFTVPDLPYPYDALAPTVDEETMVLHHDKHHQAYVDKANAALDGTAWADRPVEEVVAKLAELPDDIRGAVRNNAGGHLNHTLFWAAMSPDGGGEPGGALGDAITAAFGSFDAFKEQFEAAGVARFGSGWVWLVVDAGGDLAITSTANQDNPLTDGATPLLGNDVWEHAYYLTYRTRRPEYLGAWWAVVDWGVVEQRFAAAPRS